MFIFLVKSHTVYVVYLLSKKIWQCGISTRALSRHTLSLPLNYTHVMIT